MARCGGGVGANNSFKELIQGDNTWRIILIIEAEKKIIRLWKKSLRTPFITCGQRSLFLENVYLF